LADEKIYPWDKWAVIVNGKVYEGPALAPPDKPYAREAWMRDPAWCAKVATEVGGKCLKIPPEPDIGNPERAAWKKTWCGDEQSIVGQACVQ